MTPTGRETARSLFGDAVVCAYLPYDFATLHRRLIRHFRPEALLIMETEIWPNLIAATMAAGVPALQVNARLSEKSLRGYSRFSFVRALTSQALASMRAIGAQSEADARRLSLLGGEPAAITVTGNMKFDQRVDLALVARGEAWRRELPSGRRVLLAASTRDGEEALLFDAYLKSFNRERRRELLLVVVPRHPQRFDDVAALAASRGLAMGRRSTRLPHAEDEAWLGDSMGEMAAYFAFCDLAFIGGSLLPLGGQNLIEACAQGKPVIMGLSTFNFAEASRLAMEAGAMLSVPDAEALMMAAAALLDDEDRRQRMSHAARNFAAAHAGATEKTMGLVAPLLDAIPDQRATS